MRRGDLQHGAQGLRARPRRRRRPMTCARSRRARLSRLHHRRRAAARACCPNAHVRRGFSEQHVPGQLDLRAGERRQGRPPADLQQLEPEMVADRATDLDRLEYFCNEGDDLWRRSDGRARIARGRGARDARPRRPPPTSSTSGCSRCEKAYPAYFGATIASTSCAPGSTASRICSRRPQRHAPLQQPGPLDGERQARRRLHPRSVARARPRSGRSTSSRNTTRKRRRAPRSDAEHARPAHPLRTVAGTPRRRSCAARRSATHRHCRPARVQQASTGRKPPPTRSSNRGRENPQRRIVATV